LQQTSQASLGTATAWQCITETVGLLTTVLTTTRPDKLPCSPILHSEYGQVSHGMPQPARSLQAFDPAP
jgi:hypothetical protein